ncbi:MAG: DNA polymerase Y family protein [Acidobacteria bacterium]|nr:DNA polymerase Y family protein [Acidobacteriota bacterium]
MDRLACVDLPAFPLQLLLREHPDWTDRPAAVVNEDRSLGVILWANERAHRAGILPGLRYAAGLALAADLRAGVIPAAAIESGVAFVADRLRRFTPRVEPRADEPGVLWLDASGLDRLYPSLAAWAGEIRDDLRGAGFLSKVVAGFSRLGSYAVAKSIGAGTIAVFRDPGGEAAAARRVPLARVHLPGAARDALDRLGVRTIGDLLKLPPRGLLKRFGPEVHELHRAASGEPDLPIQPRPADEPLAARLDLDEPEIDLASLMFLVKQIVDPLLASLAARGAALSELSLRLDLERGAGVVETIRPAEPTLDAPQILGLARLRLEAARMESAVTSIAVTARETRATREQLDLFAQQTRRDPAAAARAFARVRAAFGDGSMVRARLREGHLPEASFTWEPLDRLPPRKLSGAWDAAGAGATAVTKAAARSWAADTEAGSRSWAVADTSTQADATAAAVTSTGPQADATAAADTSTGSLIRRLEAQPIPLPPRSAREPDGWLVRGAEAGPVIRLSGPYLLSGAWWRSEIRRDYYFAELKDGQVLWIFYDRRRRRWFLHGRVE